MQHLTQHQPPINTGQVGGEGTWLRKTWPRSSAIALLTGLLVLVLAQRVASQTPLLPEGKAQDLTAAGGLECDRAAILPILPMLAQLELPYSELATCQQWVEYGLGGPEEIPPIVDPGDGLEVYYGPEGESVLLLSAGAKTEQQARYAQGISTEDSGRSNLWLFGRQGDRTRPSSWAATQLRSNLGRQEPLSQFAPDDDQTALRLEWFLGRPTP
ncbi:hypothetical protein [Limnothrix sp. PR1529]|uniref:hypothetical protein n=1 Tax=Limnothrix sp. PR1529 TaxID=1704291 RepID=UPI00117AE6CD|nr:hypothetical protein [Limnothrix sp. PR1529]